MGQGVLYTHYMCASDCLIESSCWLNYWSIVYKEKVSHFNLKSVNTMNRRLKYVVATAIWQHRDWRLTHSLCIWWWTLRLPSCECMWQQTFTFITCDFPLCSLLCNFLLYRPLICQSDVDKSCCWKGYWHFYLSNVNAATAAAAAAGSEKDEENTPHVSLRLQTGEQFLLNVLTLYLFIFW